MSKFSSALTPLALGAFLLAAGTAQAGITVFTSQAAFEAAVGVSGVDTFAGLAIPGPVSGPLVRSAGAFGYTATDAPYDRLFGIGTPADPALTSDGYFDTITFDGFSAGVVGVGGNFYGVDFSSAFAVAEITLVASDAGGTSTHVLNATSTTGFVGFVSDTGMLSLVVSSVDSPSAVIWPAVDNLMLASAVTAVPEPQTYALWLAGLGVVGAVARRRR